MKITREAKIGIFAVLCLAVLFWGVNFLKGKNVFSRTSVYYAIFNRIDGLKETNDVLLNGFKVGTVKDIRFEEGHTGRLTVTILVEKQYKIPHNSVAKLISSDIMGGKAIKLDVSPNPTFHEPGDTLISQIETGLLDQIGYEMGPIKEKAEILMEEMNEVLKILGEIFNETNRTHLNSSFESINRTLENIEESSESFDLLLNSENGTLIEITKNINSISKNLAENKDEFSNIITNFSSISDSLAKVNFASTLITADSTIKSLNQILEKINRGEGSMGMLVNDSTLFENIEYAAKSLDLLLIDMKMNPKRYINFSLIDLSRDKYEKSEK
ncbi:MAG TPA: MlaD family protein [Tenuifilaceae bacterium]|nr:MlaD family protein [Tenuifilaceae bacterium]HPE17199.1 MlaD family protein [Tenuifilaceae bacterium]HPJ44753.1 MlaD family protein [Tenuifilaceae bacterium]HPQ33311.1 MlaD family protein [Tenuifilaceae bacterium]HRX67598.1 MlaD family protein [Tenuifilaceae bacterium]